MRNVALDLPTFGFIIGTRAALAAGIALLVSERLSAARRRAVGITLVAVGAVTTVPVALAVMRSLGRSARRGKRSPVLRDEHLVGATRFPRKGDDDVV